MRRKFHSYTKIAVCHNCKCNLHYKLYKDNIYSGGPWLCGNCNTDVTENIYGKKK